jgi:hypothetical protein
MLTLTGALPPNRSPGRSLNPSRWEKRSNPVFHPPFWQLGGYMGIVIQENFNKSDSQDYLAKVRFKCMKPVDQASHSIHRENYKAIVASSRDCKISYLIPLKLQGKTQ